jgi:hypothetical protein
MTSERQLAANRQNALKSTGPRTPAGRAISSLNAARHGLYASTPVIPRLENEAEWWQHRDETLASLAPLGQVETALAERVALILWRLGRVARFEEGVTSSARERVTAIVTAGQDGPLQLKENQVAVRENLTQSRAIQRALARFVEGEPETPLAGRHVTLILAAIALVDNRFSPDTFSAPDVVPDGVDVEDLPDWTVERMGRLLDAIAGSLGRQPDELVAAVSARVRELVNSDRALIRPFDLQVRDLRRQRILPRPGDLDQVIRYERHLTRELAQPSPSCASSSAPATPQPPAPPPVQHSGTPSGKAPLPTPGQSPRGGRKQTPPPPRTGEGAGG